MNRQSTLLWGAILGGLGVALGAVGAHAFAPYLREVGRVDTFELAVRYQFYHSLALLIVGLLMSNSTAKALKYSAACFLVGIVLFSGSLYGLCLQADIPFHYATPFGGISFITGWIFVAMGVLKK
jgi:uncharacterized membrane protein YgdD (TMEM256/DUF423 family)